MVPNRCRMLPEGFPKTRKGSRIHAEDMPNYEGFRLVSEDAEVSKKYNYTRLSEKSGRVICRKKHIQDPHLHRKMRGKRRRGKQSSTENNQPVAQVEAPFAPANTNESEKEPENVPIEEDVNNSSNSDDEYESVDVQSSKDKRKRSKKKDTIHLTHDETETMIEWLKDNPGLYDKRKPLWMHPARKNEKWQEQAKVIGVDWMDLQRWFNTQRRRVGQLKIKSKISGQGSIESEWKDTDQQFFLEWAFLQPHIKHVKRHTIVSIKAAHGPVPDTAKDPAADIEVDDHDPGNTTDRTQTGISEGQGSSNHSPVTIPRSSSTQNVPQTSRRSHAQATDSIIQCLMSSAERHQELVRLSEGILRANQPPEGHIQERVRFKEWVGEVLQELPQDLYDQAEEEVYRVLTRYRSQGRQRQPNPHQRHNTQTPINIQQPTYTTLQPCQSSSNQWQPAPQQWLQNPPRATSVWASQSCEYMGQYQQQQTQPSSRNRLSGTGSSDISINSSFSNLIRDIADADSQVTNQDTSKHQQECDSQDNSG